MANVDFSGHYKRFVQFFWDPEPKNNGSLLEAIWCLGERYETLEDKEVSTEACKAPEGNAESVEQDTVILPDNLPSVSPGAYDPNRGSYSKPLSTEEHQGWPAEFLDDFESRFYFTYRSHFPPIQKSADPSATSSLTLAVRLRNQLVDQGGFTSDAGFGCMIRSGQCVVANAVSILRLGRGEFSRATLVQGSTDQRLQTGGEELNRGKNANCCPYLPTILGRLSRFIDSSTTGPCTVENILGSGLALLQQQGASSMDLPPSRFSLLMLQSLDSTTSCLWT